MKEHKADSQQVYDMLVRIENRLVAIEEKIGLINEVMEFAQWKRRCNDERAIRKEPERGMLSELEGIEA